MIGRLIALLAYVVFALTSAGFAQDRDEEPVKLMRRLHQAYEAMARGDAGARLEHEQLLVAIPAALANAERRLWREPQNARAVISYVLSGGEPKALRDLLAAGLIPEQFRRLAEGAVAYAEGREHEAASRLLDIEARTLDPELSGAVALVQGVISTRTAPEKAIRFFDQARLLAPGTVVEEAALRREMLLLTAGSDIDKLKLLLQRYIQQYPRSYYADTFWQQLAKEIANSEVLSARISEVTEPLQQLDERKQQLFFSVLAEEAITRNKFPLAGVAAKHATALAIVGSREERRARILQAAALVITEEFDQAASDLGAISAGDLDHDAKVLRNAALSVARQIRRMPDHVMASRDPSAERSSSERARQLSSIGQQSMEWAREVLAKVDAMIQEDMK